MSQVLAVHDRDLPPGRKFYIAPRQLWERLEGVGNKRPQEGLVISPEAFFHLAFGWQRISHSDPPQQRHAAANDEVGYR